MEREGSHGKQDRGRYKSARSDDSDSESTASEERVRRKP